MPNYTTSQPTEKKSLHTMKTKKSSHTMQTQDMVER